MEKKKNYTIELHGYASYAPSNFGKGRNTFIVFFITFASIQEKRHKTKDL